MGTPIQRIAAPEEIAAFVSYVASDSAGFVTGKVDFLSKPSHLFTWLVLFVSAKANVYVYFPLLVAIHLTLRQVSIDGGYFFD